MIGNELTGLECLQIYLASQDFEETIGPASFLDVGEFMRVEDPTGTRIILGRCDIGDIGSTIEFRFDMEGRLTGYGARV